ncbi:MAG: DUF4923 family protein [Prevotella sp.]|jgi:hypothetical protein|nr:DUF4923 family protein [Prevotella sp.]
MKRTTILAMAAAAMMAASCGFAPTQTTGSNTSGSSAADGGVLGGILSSVGNAETMGNVLQSVLGLDKVTKENLIGTWTYYQPGCAFTSQNLLAQAGGEAVASTIRQKLSGYYGTVGIKSSNTKITFNQDGTFAATIAGKSWQGNYTFDASTYKITLSGLLLNVNCYAKRNSTGIGILFEGKKLLTLMQTMATLSGNQTAQTIGDLSKNYDGLRIGFDMK